MRALLKVYFRSLKRHVVRMVSVALIVLVSVGFSAGIGMATDKMEYALDDMYRGREMCDLILKSTRESGFTADELDKISATFPDSGFTYGASMEIDGGSMTATMDMGGFTAEAECALSGTGSGVTRVYFMEPSAEELTANKTTVLAKTDLPTPEGAVEVYAERGTEQLRYYPPGSEVGAHVTISVMGRVIERDYRFFVRGTIENPLHFATRWDPSMMFTDDDGELKELESIFYVFGAAETGLGLGATGGMINDVYVTLPRESESVTSAAYENRVRALKELAESIEGAELKALTLYDNYSFASFASYADKIRGIGYVMMVVFLLVTMLVLLSTMTRLLEEERSQIACLMTLGYRPVAIVTKYLIIALIGTLAGAALAYLAGLGLAYIIYLNFDWVYAVPAFPARTNTAFYFIVSSVMTAAVLVATLFGGLRKLRTMPAKLLRPRAPKPGRKVILERIPLLWERLSFKYKSSLRNVLRYKMRFFMTVVAVMCATALVFAGFAVLECCLVQKIGSSAMIGVSAAVLVFAALLNAAVVYTLTNINISERERELATLMVLGYRDSEVVGYMYREVYITSALGILPGLPMGALLCYAVFEVLSFGSVSAIGWYVWLITPFTSVISVILMTLLLIPRILKIKMNESLKAVE